MSRLLCIRARPLRPNLPCHARRSIFQNTPVWPRYPLHNISDIHTGTIADLLQSSSPISPSQPDPTTDEAVTVQGYVQTVRKQKRVAFAAISDGTTVQTVQAVLAPQLAEGLVKTRWHLGARC